MAIEARSPAGLKILIVEDEAIIAEDLRVSLQGLGYNVIGVVAGYGEALTFMKLHLPDLIMMDIILDSEEDGISLAEYVHKNYDIPFIFLTSHTDKATVDRAKAVFPSGYLSKPFEKEDLYRAIEVAIANFASRSKGTVHDKGRGEQNGFAIKESMFVKDGHAYVKIPIDSILYLRSDGNYIHINGKHFHHMIRSTQKEILHVLPEDKFMKVHRSYVVNVSAISAIHPNSIVMNDTKIPVQKELKKDLLSRLTIV